MIDIIQKYDLTGFYTIIGRGSRSGGWRGHWLLLFFTKAICIGAMLISHMIKHFFCRFTFVLAHGTDDGHLTDVFMSLGLGGKVDLKVFNCGAPKVAQEATKSQFLAFIQVGCLIGSVKEVIVLVGAVGVHLKTRHLNVAHVKLLAGMTGLKMAQGVSRVRHHGLAQVAWQLSDFDLGSVKFFVWMLVEEMLPGRGDAGKGLAAHQTFVIFEGAIVGPLFGLLGFRRGDLLLFCFH